MNTGSEMMDLRHPLWLRLLFLVSALFFALLCVFLCFRFVQDLIIGNFQSSIWGAGGCILSFVCLNAAQQRLNFMSDVIASEEGVSGRFIVGGFDRFFLRFKKVTVAWSELLSAKLINSVDLKGSVLREYDGYGMLKLVSASGELLVYSKLSGFSEFLSILQAHGIKIEPEQNGSSIGK